MDTKTILLRLASGVGVVFWGMAVIILMVVPIVEMLSSPTNPVYNEPMQTLVFGAVAIGFGIPAFKKVFDRFMGL